MCGVCSLCGVCEKWIKCECVCVCVSVHHYIATQYTQLIQLLRHIAVLLRRNISIYFQGVYKMRI